MTVVVPTRHEAGNVTVLADALESILDRSGFDWQVLFVDDSDDETVETLSSLAAERGRVDVLHRPAGAREGGLSGAVLAGIDATSSRWIAVMDGDLQHPPAVVLDLLAPLARRAADVVVATRYCEGGSNGGLAGPARQAVSRISRRLVTVMFPKASAVSDPLGGFFAFDRRVVAGAELRPEGFKILLEVLVRGHWDRVAEVPYEFATRIDGTSKASVREGLRFARHLLRLRRAQPSHAGWVTPQHTAAS